MTLEHFLAVVACAIATGMVMVTAYLSVGRVRITFSCLAHFGISFLLIYTLVTLATLEATR